MAPRNRVPQYRHHKASGRAFVELNGHRHYLGPYSDAETREKYRRRVAEWLANGRRLPVDPNDITLTEICAAFWRHVKSYYRRADGSATSEVSQFRLALRALQALYGRSRAADFGPRSLKAVRETMVDGVGFEPT